jgi:hypothetical protein
MKKVIILLSVVAVLAVAFFALTPSAQAHDCRPTAGCYVSAPICDRPVMRVEARCFPRFRGWFHFRGRGWGFRRR